MKPFDERKNVKVLCPKPAPSFDATENIQLKINCCHSE